MAATLAQLRSQLEVNRPEIKGNINFPKAVLNLHVNLAQRYVQVQLATLGIKQWEASDSLTLAADTWDATSVKKSDLSTDCPNRLFDDKRTIKYIKCSYSAGASTDKGTAHYVDDDYFGKQIANTYLTGTTQDPIFTRSGGYIYISPSTIDTATAVYYKVLTDLSSDSDTTGIPGAYEGFIVKRALLEIDDILNRIQNKDEKIAQLTKDLTDSFQALSIGVSQEESKQTL